jgi:hypothetical protein
VASSPAAGGGIPALLRAATGDALGGGLGRGPVMLQLDGVAPTLEQWFVSLAQRGTDLRSDGATGLGTTMGLGMTAGTPPATLRPKVGPGTGLVTAWR